MRTNRQSLIATLLVAIAVPVWADDAPPVAESDPAFDRYVDLNLLGDALVSLNAPQAADVALQLADGERALGRPHHAMNTDGAFDLALRLAVTMRDANTLDRLLRVSRANGRAEWVAQLEGAQALLASSRAAEPALDTASMSEGAQVFAAAVVEALRMCQVAGDVAAFGEFKTAIRESELVNDAERAALIKFADSLQVTPREAQGEGDAPDVGALAFASRGNDYLPPVGSLALDLSGGVVVGPAIDRADLLVANQMGVAVTCPSAITSAGTLAISNGKDIAIDARSSKVVITAYTTKEIKIKVPAGGFPPKMKTITNRTRLPLKVQTISMGFGLTGGKPVRAAPLKK